MTKRRWLAAGLLLLAVNSSWLVAFPAASLIYVGNVLAHIGIGLALVALLASSRNVVRELWSQGGRGALTAFGVAALTGGALRRRCDTRESQSHGGARRRRVRRHSAHPVGVAASYPSFGRWGVAALAIAVLLPAGELLRQRVAPTAGTERILNPATAPLTMEG